MARRGKGIATYFPPNFALLKQVTHDTFQITSISSNNLIVTNVYRSTHCHEDFLNTLTDFILHDSKSHILMGDLNFCQRQNPHHPVKQLLENHNFHPAIQPPTSTHKDGRCLDQIYIRLTPKVVCNISVHTTYYSDHEPISITLTVQE